MLRLLHSSKSRKELVENFDVVPYGSKPQAQQLQQAFLLPFSLAIHEYIKKLLSLVESPLKFMRSLMV